MLRPFALVFFRFAGSGRGAFARPTPLAEGIQKSAAVLFVPLHFANNGVLRFLQLNHFCQNANDQF